MNKFYVKYQFYGNCYYLNCFENLSIFYLSDNKWEDCANPSSVYNNFITRATRMLNFKIQIVFKNFINLI